MRHPGAVACSRRSTWRPKARIDATRAGAYADECEWLAAQPGGEASFGAFRQLVDCRVSEYANALRDRDWFWAPGEMRARLVARAIALIVLGTGAAKLAVGLSRGRAVPLLVISMAAFAIAYRIVAGRLTGFGQGGLTVGARVALDAHGSAHRDAPESADALLSAAALSGAGVLAGAAWAAYSIVLVEPPPMPPTAVRGGGSTGPTYSSSDYGANCSSSSSCSSSSCNSSSCGGCSSNS
ncbi:TIGR04222 domain-containing membrane protein [Burkholderia sp. Bp9143]|nr:TIGR04222 domain-containing membrane protein [Burkholderia sp. Bp9143]